MANKFLYVDANGDYAEILEAWTDNHSGYYYIPAALTVTIAENKQMTTFGNLTVEGFLIVEGQSIIEA